MPTWTPRDSRDRPKPERANALRFSTLIRHSASRRAYYAGCSDTDRESRERGVEEERAASGGASGSTHRALPAGRGARASAPVDRFGSLFLISPHPGSGIKPSEPPARVLPAPPSASLSLSRACSFSLAPRLPLSASPAPRLPNRPRTPRTRPPSAPGTALRSSTTPSRSPPPPARTLAPPRRPRAPPARWNRRAPTC